MKISLYPYQQEALSRMKNGCILCGGVGSGKSRTALAYYFTQNLGRLENPFKRMKKPQDLYIITTARKRDTNEWEEELLHFQLSTHTEKSSYKNTVVVDSWNNISKYDKKKGAFFIFDEQRVVGSGTWSKSFIKIAKGNNWILLSATPGDTWIDYIPVFVANGFYKNRSEFVDHHVIYRRFSKFPQIDRYLGESRLNRLRDAILIDMHFERKTIRHKEDVYVKFDVDNYKYITKNRWNIWKNKPLKNAAEYCYALRKLVNTDQSRQVALLEILEDHPKAIIFYNFNYELDILKNLGYSIGTKVAEWNRIRHDPIPIGESWVYLVQYTSGAEGWNCTTTDTVIFFSQNYSYKIVEQASGRIDRLNTPYTDLYYYHLKSGSGIDLAISKALSVKKKFNESRFVKW